MNKTLLAAACWLVTLLPLAAAAAPEHYQLNRPHTQILFSVNHLGFSNSQGKFLDYDGSFTFDPQDWSKSAVKVAIRTASLDMGDYDWEKHLKSKDFFNVSQFPEMTFTSTRVEKTGTNTGRIYGDLTLLGVTRPVTLEVKFNKAGEFPMKKGIYEAGFSATAVIKRSEFGMKFAVPLVGDDVHVHLEVEGVRE